MHKLWYMHQLPINLRGGFGAKWAVGLFESTGVRRTADRLSSKVVTTTPVVDQLKFFLEMRWLDVLTTHQTLTKDRNRRCSPVPTNILDWMHSFKYCPLRSTKEVELHKWWLCFFICWPLLVSWFSFFCYLPFHFVSSCVLLWLSTSWPFSVYTCVSFIH